jgi:hypothetical protein
MVLVQGIRATSSTLVAKTCKLGTILAQLAANHKIKLQASLIIINSFGKNLPSTEPKRSNKKS